MVFPPNFFTINTWRTYCSFLHLEAGFIRSAMVSLVSVESLFQDLRRWRYLSDEDLFGQTPRMLRKKYSLSNLQYAGMDTY